MGIKKLVKPAADQVTEGTFLDSALNIITAPTKAFSVSDTYINEQDAGMASLTHLVVGLGVGEAVGHYRSRKGKKSFLPIFRG